MVGSVPEEIKGKLDIVEFLKEYLTLQPAGKNFKALCPFHREKTPSFMISPERQSWRCFGCNLGGDHFTFVMQYENVEFGEALRMLAEKAGVELRRLSPQEYKHFGLLYDINAAAKEFFRKELENSKEAREYLTKRKLTEETVDEFELGWAPNNREALTLQLLNIGFSPPDVIRAGLSFKTDRGLQMDRFRGRIMFPIHNHSGKVVGFTGRILPRFDTGEMGKYINSPETPIFNKSKLLYGFWKSKNHIRERGEALLVEGQTDFLASWQVGVRYVVATSGTALTPNHLRVLRRLTERLIISFDSDEAGWAAGERAVDLAGTHDFAVRAALFTNYDDPADAAMADAREFAKIVTNACSAMEFYFEKYLPAEGGDARDRAYLLRVREVLKKIASLASPIERSAWLKALAKRTAISEEALAEEMAGIAAKLKVATRKRETSEEAPATDVCPRRDRVSQHLLSALLAYNDLTAIGEYATYLPPLYREAFAVLETGERRAPANAGLDQVLNDVVLGAGVTDQPNIDDLKHELLREYVREERERLTAVVRQAESSGNAAALEEALLKLTELPTL